MLLLGETVLSKQAKTLKNLMNLWVQADTGKLACQFIRNRGKLDGHETSPL